jgi:hypothetical protein
MSSFKDAIDGEQITILQLDAREQEPGVEVSGILYTKFIFLVIMGCAQLKLHSKSHGKNIGLYEDKLLITLLCFWFMSDQESETKI